jgi:hypothetical protein
MITILNETTNEKVVFIVDGDIVKVELYENDEWYQTLLLTPELADDFKNHLLKKTDSNKEKQ